MRDIGYKGPFIKLRNVCVTILIMLNYYLGSTVAQW